MSDETRAMANELEALLKGGGFDPTAMLAGDWRFHSVFIAPFTPWFGEARKQFLADGTGHLSSTVEQLSAQGMPYDEAVKAARGILEATQALCVAVVSSDHGVTVQPQPFFGHFSPEWRAGASRVLGDRHQAELAQALDRLATAALPWPGTVAATDGSERDLAAYWLDLAHGCADSLELVGTRTDGRLADLSMWVIAAFTALPPCELDAEDHAALARCALAAGEIEPACGWISSAGECGGGEAVTELLDALAGTVCLRGGDAQVEAWLAESGGAMAATLGCAYDAALAWVRIVAASGGDAPRLRPAVAALIAADRKLARQALTREPLWQVTAADPGELVDTAAAADLIGRSPAFVSKRLEARTIPFHVRDGSVRLPRTALLAWKTVLDEHQALA